uniref:mucin-5AC n=1 Tax=Jaculus jaculus TaxID=51337 RepID=UPI001E1B1C1E|nr:mucin-5AC [Jaculus jaculus]
MLQSMSVGRRRLALLWALVLAVTCSQRTGQAQHGSTESDHEHRSNLSLHQGHSSTSLRGVTVIPPLRTIPVVRALDPAHTGRVCSTWGDFHYKTFDGAVFRFPGLCNYVFSAHCGAAYEDFNIQLRRGQEANATAVSRVVMKLDGLVVELSKTTVLVNNHPVQLPFSQSGVFIELSSGCLKVVARLGVVFMWNYDDSLLLELDAKYANKTCGLCGDFNGSPVSSEFLSHNAKLTPLEFGNLQKMDGPTEQCQDPLPTAQKDCSISSGICEEVLRGPLFSGCAALVNVTSYVEACQQDLCFCESPDLPSCICHTLAEYSRQCAHAGGLPQDWRGPDLCPQTCPLNMQHQECGSPCVDTCSNPRHSQLCEDHCVAGCFCPEGMVLDDINHTGCVPVSQCACLYNGTSYAPGTSYSTDCTKCTCSGGWWSCQEVPCPGTCSVLGGAHFSTFDERQYTVHGDCNYVLTKLCDSNAFTVLAELRRCGLTDSETCLKSVTLSLGGGQTVVVIKASGEVFVNQIYTQLPVSAANVTLFRPSTFFIIAQTHLGLQLEVQLVPTMQVFVRLAPELRGLTCGLCGNFNSIQADDFRTISGVAEGTAAAFFNTFKTQAACPNVKNVFEDPCSLSVENEKYAQHWCSQLTDASGPFSQCHATVSPSTYFSNCMFDTCNCEKSEDCMCAALSSYVRACAARGVLLRGWRDGVCTKPTTTCPKSMTYHYQISTCQPTCRALSEEDVTCHVNFVPVDGCACPAGTFLDDSGKCVQATSCPCYHRGSTVPNGESVHDGGAVCTCTQGTLTCIGGPAPTPACDAPMVYLDCRNATSGDPGAGCQKSCHTLDMACYSSECVPGCVCPDGLVADGSGGCVAAEDCPCVHNEATYRPGETIRVGCNNCTCENRLWQCTDEPCLATCAVYGDGHFLTFDGRRYSFSGNCEYTLVQDNCGGNSSSEEAFRVVTENVPCGTTGTTCSKDIKIFLGSYELKLSDGKVEVVQKGVGQEAPYTIRQMGIYLVVETDVGLMLLWDRKTSIFLRLGPEFKGRVCGLCGNFDDSAVNDFTTRSHSVVGDALEFGNSWKFSPSCPDAALPKDPCTANPYRKSWAQKQCSLINSATFATCHAHVEPAKYYEACVSDACACDSGGDCECFCTAVAAYAQACHEVGVCVSWRTPDICPLFCDYYNPEGQCAWHYQPCGAPCLRTCQNPSGHCSQDLRGIEGCYPKCPPTAPIFDEDQMQCVTTCPTPTTSPRPSLCNVNGKLYRPGATVFSDKNCQSCVCTKNGVHCVYDVDACVCTYNGQRFHPGDVIYHTTDGMGACISAYCRANGTIERRVDACSPATPTPPTTFSFSTPPLVVTSMKHPGTDLSSTQSTMHTGSPGSASPGKTSATASSLTTTSCGEECLWSPWMDVSHPGQGIDSGDFDTLENLRAHGYRVCQMPRAVECQAEDFPKVPLHSLGQRVECSPAVGLICHNREQVSGLCYNYQVRILCCSPVACPTSSRPTQTPHLTSSRNTKTGTTESLITCPPHHYTDARSPLICSRSLYFCPRSLITCPPHHYTDARPLITCPPYYYTDARSSLICPRSLYSCPRSLITCPPHHYTDARSLITCPPHHYTDARSSLICPRSLYSCPRSLITCPPHHYTDARSLITCPPHHYTDARSSLICPRSLYSCPRPLITCSRSLITCPPHHYTYTRSSLICPRSLYSCPSSPVPGPSSPSPHTNTSAPGSSAPISMTLSTTSSRPAPTKSTTSPCFRELCSWTEWMDGSYPQPGINSGDFDTFLNLRSQGYKFCDNPQNVECRAQFFPNTPLEELGQVVTCNRKEGLICLNKDQLPPICYNYEIRLQCCEVVNLCLSASTHATSNEASVPTQASWTTTMPSLSTSHTAAHTSTVHTATPTIPVDCQPRCTWTKWFDTDFPVPGPQGGDEETYSKILRRGEKICHRPQDITRLQCRAQNYPEVSVEQLGQVVHCDPDVGLVCQNSDQHGASGMCLNYEVRVLCCQTPEHCTTTSPFLVPSTSSEGVPSPAWSTTPVHKASTTSVPQTSTTSIGKVRPNTEHTASTTFIPKVSTTSVHRGSSMSASTRSTSHVSSSGTPPSSGRTTDCTPRCTWTKWFDTDFPVPGPHGGDLETYSNILKRGEKICHHPETITRLQCRAESHPEVSLEELGQVVQCNPEVGLVCRNRDQQGPSAMCLNYEVRVLCCETPEGCPTVPPSPGPSTSSESVPSPAWSTSPVHTASTTSVPQTSLTSIGKAIPTSEHAVSTISTPQTRTTSTGQGRPPSEHTVSTISTPQTRTTSTGQGRPPSEHTVSTISTPQTRTTSTGQGRPTSEPMASTISTPQTRKTSSGQGRSPSEHTASTTFIPKLSTTSVHRGSSMSASTRSTSHVAPSGTTPSPGRTTDCTPRCTWTKWFDTDFPVPGPHGGDLETYSNILRRGEKICHHPEAITRLQCRAESHPEVSLEELGQVVQCNPEVGLVCRNRDQQGPSAMCLNYEVRVLCCQTPEGCPTVPPSPGPSTSSESVPSPAWSTSPVHTASTTSVPQTSLTSIGKATPTSEHTVSTISIPQTRTTSTGQGRPTSEPTASTISTPQTRTTSTGQGRPTSEPMASTISTPQTRKTSRGQGRPTSEPTASTISTPQTRKTSRGQGRPTSEPTASIISTPQTRTTSTGQGRPTSEHTASTTSTPQTRPTSTGQGRPTPEHMASTTFIPKLSTTSVHRGSSMSASTRSTSHVSSSGTTPSPGRTTDCTPRCTWTKWFDTDFPVPGPHGGDLETYSNILRRGEKICHHPETITRLQCRAESHPEVSLEELGQVVQCNPEVGLVCRNRDQQGPSAMCLNYEVRVLCCQTPEGCPTVPPSPGPSTSSESVPSPAWSTSPVHTASTTSVPQTSLTSIGKAIPTSEHAVSTISTPQTRTTSTGQGRPPSEHTVSTISTPQTRTTSTGQGRPPSEHTVSTISTPQTRTTSTGQGRPTSEPMASTISTPQTRKTSSGQGRSPSEHTASTTFIPKLSTTSVHRGSSMSASTRSTSHVAPSGTTPSPGRTTDCTPRCTWTKWFDTDFPVPGPHGGDLETYSNILRRGEKICHHPETITRLQCRAESHPEVSLEELGQVVQCNPEVGLVCRNRDQQGPSAMCLNYEVRVLCCETPEGCPTVPPSPGPSTSSESVPSPAWSTSPVHTASTTSVPQTSLTSIGKATPTSEHAVSTISTPQTRTTSTGQGRPPSEHTVSTISTPQTRTTSTGQGRPTSEPMASTISTPQTRKTSSGQGRSPSEHTASTTFIPKLSTTSVHRGSSMSASTRSTSHVSSSGTTPSPGRTTDCTPRCTWTKWFDTDFPVPGPHGGDLETYSNILRRGEKICHHPETITRLQCRAESHPEVSLEELGQVVQCNPEVGLVCRNRDQQGPSAMCLNYEVRVLCCETPEGCPTVPPSPGPSTSSESVPSPAWSTSPVHTASTTSVPQTSLTSIGKATPTSEHAVSTISTPQTRTTSTGQGRPPSEHTVSTISTPQTRTTSTGQGRPTSEPMASTISTPQTRKTSRGQGRPPSEPTASTISTPQTRTTSTGQGRPTSEHTVSTTSTPQTRKKSTGQGRPTSEPMASTISTPQTRPTSTGQGRSPSEHTASTTFIPKLSTTSVHRGSSMSASTRSTSHVAPSGTTPSPGRTTDCTPRCTWTKWFDTDFPVPGPHGGDLETYSNILRRGEKICHHPETITRLQCRAESHPEVSLEELGQVVQCNPEVGLVCRNRDQQGPSGMCLNYEVRMLCCETPEGCPVTSATSHMPSLPTKTSFPVPSPSSISPPWSPRPTEHSTTSCFCSVSGKLFHAGSLIYRQVDLAGHCYYALCSQDCRVLKGVSQDCPSTTPSPTSSLSLSTPTSAPTTDPGVCFNVVPPRKKGETWPMPNCLQATCGDNQVISLSRRRCPELKAPVCANGYPAVKVADQDGCCWHYQCQCVCSGWGDPHYITFDGTYYTFLDNCTYVLVQQIVPVFGHFRVLIDNYFCDLTDGISCPQSIIVEYHQDRVVLTRRPVGGVMTNQIIFNNKVVSPGFQKNGIAVSRIGIKMYVTIKEIGVQVMFSGLIFSVEVPFSKFTNNTEGQCGTCSNDKRDECRLPGGAIASSCSEMSGHWKVHDPDQKFCQGPHRTAVPTPTPASCSPSPICQLILSNVFQLCHDIIAPQQFYEGCMFDYCHMTDLDVICSGLELYASLCAAQGVCIDWRSWTNNTCSFTCPAGKVYQPCGPSSLQYCYGNDSNAILALPEAGPITEGCFCPDSMTYFSASDPVCVPAHCPWCLGPHGEPMEPGHTVSAGCQECTCEEATLNLTCHQKPCPLPPTCPDPGFVAIPEALEPDQCCPQFSCVCNSSYCPAPLRCPDGFRLTVTNEKGACCPRQSCTPTACSVNGTLYQPGAVVSSSLCETCWCELSSSSQSDAFVVNCETQLCNTHCPLGYEYRLQSGQCCGHCDPVACVKSTSPVILVPPGEIWSEPGDHCATHKCEKIGDRLEVVTMKKECPELDCPPDQAQLSEDGCCHFCTFSQKNLTCQVHHRREVIRQQGCSSEEPVSLSYCQGQCGDSMAMYSLEANMVEHKCQCCQELRTSQRTVTLRCADGSSRAFSYTQVEECSCLGQQCHVPGDTSHSESSESELKSSESK